MAPVVETEKELKRVKGVGCYTARLTLAPATGRYEFPPVNRWLKGMVSVVYGIDEYLVKEYWVKK
ncbi:MAG: hypothetical protein QXP89_00700 [Desulfurococcaceae archaeon]